MNRKILHYVVIKASSRQERPQMFMRLGESVDNKLAHNPSTILLDVVWKPNGLRYCKEKGSIYRIIMVPNMFISPHGEKEL